MVKRSGNRHTNLQDYLLFELRASVILAVMMGLARGKALVAGSLSTTASFFLPRGAGHGRPERDIDE